MSSAERRLERVDEISTEPSTLENGGESGRIPKRFIFSGILLALNLLNYMDRFTVAGTLVDIQLFYGVSDSLLGLIQTVFVICYMLAAPIFGYCGDRYNRKWLICAGLSIWIMAVLVSSFGENFGLFLLSRAIVGVGEAAYSTIAPSIIGDLFTGNDRSKVLMIYFTAMPIGSGLGYIVGSSVASWASDWRWGLRTTPLIGILLLIILFVYFEDPQRGGADHARVHTTRYSEDVASLLKIPTYVQVTAGQTSVMFVTGGLSWWAPTLTEHAWAMLNRSIVVPSYIKADIGRTFGILMCVGGLLGVTTGSIAARYWRQGILLRPPIFFYNIQRRIRTMLTREEQLIDFEELEHRRVFKLGPNHRADPLVCAISSLLAVPIMWLALLLFGKSMGAGWVFTFVAIILLCVNFSITTDMILYVTPPNRRATAVAVQTLFGHLLGDAASPYVVGLLSDWLKSSHDPATVAPFTSLRNAFYLPNLVLILSALFYLNATKSVEKDQELCAVIMHDLEPPSILDVNVEG